MNTKELQELQKKKCKNHTPGFRMLIIQSWKADRKTGFSHLAYALIRFSRNGIELWISVISPLFQRR